MPLKPSDYTIDDSITKTMPPVPACLEKWRSEGTIKTINGMKIFVHASGPKDPDGKGVLIVHGYPGSSWDWQGVVAHIEKKTHVVVCDMRGLGLSEKPDDGDFNSRYSLEHVQAEIQQAVAVDAGLKSIVLVAHDMGQTVGLELVTRQEEGRLPFRIRHTILCNGSTLINMVKLIPLQENLLAAPDTVPESGPMTWEEFSKGVSDSYKGNIINSKPGAVEEALLCQTHQVAINGGIRLQPRIIRYQNERKEKLPRWSGTFFGMKSCPLTVCWGIQDPISVVDMAHKVKKERPYTDLYIMQGVSHWPSIEVPQFIGDKILQRLECD